MNTKIMNELNLEDIMEEIEKDEEDRNRYIELKGLYKGKHPILDRKPKTKSGANNKIVVNHIKTTIDMKVGYITGIPVLISADKSEKIQEVLDSIFSYNDFEIDLIQEQVKGMCISGKNYIIVSQDIEGNTRLTTVPAEEMIVYKDEYGVIEFAIRYYYITQVDDEGNEELRLYVEVYTAETISYYIENNEEVLEEYKEEERHIFGAVPIVEFANNSNETGDIEPIEELNHVYNSIISDMADENQDVRNYYLGAKGMIVDDELIRLLREENIVPLTEDGSLEFIVKDPKTESMERYLDRLEEEIYRTAQVPNIKDENFAGNSSGVAMQYKMIPLQNNAIIKERELEKSIKRLLTILKPVIKIKTGQDFEMKDITIQFGRSGPSDLSNIEEVVKLAKADIVDENTVLSLLDFVDDPGAIIEKRKKEKQDKLGLSYGDNHASS